VITRIHLRNFRRHVDTDLTFDPADQLVVVAGLNGTGKSTLIVEALLFAFYGETRNGRSDLDRLVRRGADLEGCEAVVEFRLAGNLWRAQRRRCEGVTSAILWCDGQAVCDRPSAVTAEMTRLLGTDAAGFRLATVAKQKELDGFISMDRNTRKRLVARLAGVEQLARAVVAANQAYTRAADLVDAMGSPPDVDALGAAQRAAADAEGAARAALDAARASVAALDAELAADVVTDEAYAAAVAATRTAEGRLAGLREELDRATAEFAAADPGPQPPPPADVNDLVAAMRAADAAVAAARDAQAAHRHRADLAAEATSLAAQHDQLVAALADAETAAAAAARLAGDLDRVVDEGQQARAAQRAADTALAAARARVADLEAREAAFDTVGAVCDRCGQDVPDTHRAAHRAELVATLALAAGVVRRAETELVEVTERLEMCLAAHRTLSAQAADAARAARDAEHLRRQVAELRRRLDTYQAQIDRPLPEVGDFDALTAAAAAARAAFDEASTVRAVWEDWQRRVDRRAHLADTVAAIEARVAAAADDLEAARPTVELVGAHRRRAELRAARDAEASMVAELSAVWADAAAASAAATARLADASSFAARRAERVAAAHVAAFTKTVLRATHDRLSAQLRPALEAEMSRLLHRMSGGRFSSVRLTDDFDVSVFDTDGYQPLSELSGGEQDLVALSTRLALAAVVGERHGGNGLGVLVLDEVFGSQDAERRTTLLGALRELRSTYAQIFLISHVGGIEDAADKVIEIQTDQGRSTTDVVVF
jgi:exonuclease SbcC